MFQIIIKLQQINIMYIPFKMKLYKIYTIITINSQFYTRIVALRRMLMNFLQIAALKLIKQVKAVPSEIQPIIKKFTFNLEKKDDYEFLCEIAKVNGMMLQYFDETIRQDPIIALLAIQQNPKAISSVEKVLDNDANIVEEIKHALQNNKLSFEDLNAHQKLNPEFIRIAIIKDDQNFAFIEESLRDELSRDKKFMRSVIEKNPRNYRNCSEDLKKDTEIALTALHHATPFPFDEIDAELKNNRDFIINAVKESLWLLHQLKLKQEKLKIFIEEEIVSLQDSEVIEKIQHDRELMMVAIIKNAEIIKKAAPTLLADRQFIIRALQENNKIFQYLDEDKRNDQKLLNIAIQDNPENIKHAGELILQKIQIILDLAVKHDGILAHLDNDQKNNIADEMLRNKKIVPMLESQLQKIAYQRIDKYIKEHKLSEIGNLELLGEYLVNPENKSRISSVIISSQPFLEGHLIKLCNDHDSFKKNLTLLMTSKDNQELVRTIESRYPELYALTMPQKPTTPLSKEVRPTFVPSILGSRAASFDIKEAKKHIHTTRTILKNAKHQKKEESIIFALEEFNKHLNSAQCITRFTALCKAVCHQRTPVILKEWSLKAVYNYLKENAEYIFKKITNDSLNEEEPDKYSTETTAAKGLIKLLTDNVSLREAVDINTDAVEADGIKNAIKEKIEAIIAPSRIENKL